MHYSNMGFARIGAIGATWLALIGSPAWAQVGMGHPVPGQNAAAFGLVTGTVAYLQRSALPPNAILRVRLEDVSRQDVASRLVAEVTLPTNGKQVPLPFAVPYRRADILAQHRYQVRATLLVQDKMLFTTTTAYPVLTGGAPSQIALMVQAVGATPVPAPPRLAETYWKLTALRGLPALATGQREANLMLHAQGNRLSGSSGCNQVVGTYRLQGMSLRFSPAGTTMMMCPAPLQQQEKIFMEALKATTTYQINGSVLELRSGTVMQARFVAQPSR